MKRCACAILYRERKILLGRRSPYREFYPNVWDLIGGHCENRESPEQALLRELKEELDITPTKFREIEVLDEPNVEAYGEYQYYVYLVTDWNGVPRNHQPQEHSEVQWFSVEEALGLELAHPHYPVLFKEIPWYKSDSREGTIR